MTADFNTTDFVMKLAEFLARGNRDEEMSTERGAFTLQDWERVGQRALAKSRRVPLPTFTYGSLLNAEREIVQGREVIGTTIHTTPERGGSSAEDNMSDGILIIEQLKQILDDEGPINLFHLIINPRDFGQSVENLYYLSFLVRDGLCVLHTADNAETMVSARRCPAVNDTDSPNIRRQIIMEFDMATWKMSLTSPVAQSLTGLHAPLKLLHLDVLVQSIKRILDLTGSYKWNQGWQPLSPNLPSSSMLTPAVADFLHIFDGAGCFIFVECFHDAKPTFHIQTSPDILAANHHYPTKPNTGVTFASESMYQQPDLLHGIIQTLANDVSACIVYSDTEAFAQYLVAEAIKLEHAPYVSGSGKLMDVVMRGSGSG
ncbi:hypothetical protein BDR05DRAFT_1002616 [Suillus weaverae]|nr:hypothetical protein BDR05DRAFT_1002616 [Suillus weaverae]